MSFAETVLLGALAGFTIFLGLPVGRLQILNTRGRVCLAMFAVGILSFIFVDVLAHGFEMVENAVTRYKDHTSSFGHVAAFALLLAGGFGIGSAGLATLERRMRPKNPAPKAPIAGGSAEASTAAPGWIEGLALDAAEARAMALRTGMTIAAAIGLHNFAEGLAIGVSARAGEIGLATVLIVGFALHNATEGFGVVGPLGAVRPSWTWLGLAGLVAGGPTFIGSLVGYRVTSEPLELLFYAVAGGAILYVIGEVWQSMRRHGHRELGMWLLAVGFMVGVLTDLIVAYGGG